MENNQEQTSSEIIKIADSNPPPRGFIDYSEGDIEPTLKKRIKHLIQKDREFIVYLDDEYFVNWVTNGRSYGDYAPDFGAIMSRVGYLESTSRGLLSNNQLEALELIIGDGVARLLDDRNSTYATASLDKAEEYLKARTTEHARTWYISAAAAVSAFALVCGFIFWLLRDWIQGRIGLVAFAVLLGASAGSLGALISIISRMGKIDIDALAGKRIHYFEGGVRIIAGMAGAILVTLAVKANILLGALDSAEKSLPLLLVVAMVAGASERIVPNLIKTVEGTISVDSSAKGQK
ncbi:MAG: hypothetical protein QOH63_3927 [Acidobacteriota bacterium]|jgi:hypothetical protein|nr:hypothetical protein [Acidobacteriota bacterium]